MSKRAAVENTRDVQALQTRLGHVFSQPSLLARALVHRSYLFEHRRSVRADNETLEFLGDAVLDLVVAAMLFRRYPKMAEGEMTKLRAALVQASHLAAIARDLGLGRFVRLGRGEEASGGRDKDSILSCAYEAVIGAVFEDGGYEAASRVVERHFGDRIEGRRKDVIMTDAKSRLQELMQGRHGAAPSYRLEGATGPDHEREFTVSVRFQGAELGRASARSKKKAEQKAAAMALRLLGHEG